MNPRDMTEKQFLAALTRHGFGQPGHFGYVPLPEPHSNVHVCMFNGGDRLRDALAYLIQEWKREVKRAERQPA